MSRLKVVGVGPGSPDYVTDGARKFVEGADVVIGSERALKLLQDRIECETLMLTAQTIKDALTYGVKSAEAGKNVTILSTGDPGFSGLLGSLLRIAGSGVEVDVVPGVSSVQVCAARLRMCWDTAELISFHADASKEKRERLLEALRRGKKVILLPDQKAFSPRDIAEFLIEEGIDEQAAVSVCENLTLDDERVVRCTLKEVLGQKFDRLCVMVVGER